MAKYTKEITVNCPACSSGRVAKRGRRHGYQRFSCLDCNKWFNDSGNTPGKRFPSNHVGAAIRMFYSGMSYKQIAETMEDMYDIPEPSKRAIYSWVKQYTKAADKKMEDHKADVGDEWVVDEMQVKVGGQKYWNWNVMDKETRYILASHLSKRRDAREARKVLRKAAANAASTPKTIKTDRLKSYISAVDDVFGADSKHFQTDGIRAEVNNNLSERLQGTFRQCEKTLRGLDSRESGQLYLDGWVLTYNLFRDHESTGGKPPGDKANPGAPFKSWEDVVEQTGARRVVVKEVAAAKPEGKGRRSPSRSKRLPATADLHQ